MKSLLLILLLIFTFVGCSSDGEEKKEKEKETIEKIVYSEKTVIFKVSDNSTIISYKAEESELILNKDSELAKSLKEGSVIISPILDKLPTGLLKKVSSIDNTGENTVLKLEYAHLNEAITEGRIKDTITLDPKNIIEQKKFYDETKGDGFTLAEFSQEFVHNFSINVGSGDKSLKIIGSAGIAPSLDIDIDFGWTIIEKLSMTLNLKSTAKVSINGKYYDKYQAEEILLASYKFAPIHIADTPITVCPEISLYIGFDGEINGEVSFSVSERAEASISAEFETSLTESIVEGILEEFGFAQNEGTWKPVTADIESDFDWSDPYFNFNGNLRTYLKPKASLSLFEYESDKVIGAASISIAAKLFMKGIIDLTGNPWWKINAGIEGVFESKGKLLPDKTLSFDILSETIAQADGEYDPNQNIVKGLSNLYYFDDEDMNFYKPYNIIKVLPQADGKNLAIIQVSGAGGYYLAKMDKKGKVLSAVEGFIFCDDEDPNNVDCAPFNIITDAIDTGDALIVTGQIPTISKVDKETGQVIWAKKIYNLEDPNDIAGTLDEMMVAWEPGLIAKNNNTADNYVARLTRSLIFFDADGNLSINRYYYYSSDEVITPDPEFWKSLTIESLSASASNIKINVSYTDTPWVLYKEGSSDTINIGAGSGDVIESSSIFSEHDYSDDLENFIATPSVSILNENNQQIIAGKYVKNELRYTHWIAKLDENNKQIWNVPFCLSTEARPMQCDFESHENMKGYTIENIALVESGGIILSGKLSEDKKREDGETSVDNSSFVVKFTDKGNFAWGKVFNTKETRFLQDNYINSIIERTDKKGIILAGRHELGGIARAWFVFLTNTGEVSFKNDSDIEVTNLGGIFELSNTKKKSNSTKKSNKSEGDTDGDFVCDGNTDIENICFAGPDNCPNTKNRLQLDHDSDGKGDECDDDDDNDGVCDYNSGEGCTEGPDNCQFIANQNQLDTDSDTIGDECDLHDKETRKFGNSSLNFLTSSHDSSAMSSYNDYIGSAIETVLISE